MDVSQYLEVFIEEAKEHLQALNEHLLILEKEPENENTINEIFRAAHSLKGMAGTMGLYGRCGNDCSGTYTASVVHIYTVRCHVCGSGQEH